MTISSKRNGCLRNQKLAHSSSSAATAAAKTSTTTATAAAAAAGATFQRINLSAFLTYQDIYTSTSFQRTITSKHAASFSNVSTSQHVNYDQLIDV